MTNEEAIELLDSFRIYVAPTLREAMSVAISALKAQDKLANHSPELDKKNGDLIRKKGAIDAINELHDKPNAWLDLAVDALEKLPSAQPIIRCKECVHADEYYHCDYMTTWNYGDCFCSYGKRRTDG